MVVVGGCPYVCVCMSVADEWGWVPVRVGLCMEMSVRKKMKGRLLMIKGGMAIMTLCVCRGVNGRPRGVLVLGCGSVCVKCVCDFSLKTNPRHSLAFLFLYI